MNRAGAAWLAVAAGCGLALAGYIYRPWETVPFDIWDFREFLPLLRRTTAAGTQLADLLAYYATHGRRNVLFYGSFVAQWQLFGEANLGWQLVRFGVMTANLVLAFHLLRQLGASRFGALAGAGLLIAASPVLRGWVQLMAEPQALLALQAGALLALRYQATSRWQAAGLGLAFMVAFVVLSKEVLVGLAGWVVLVALCRQPDGAFRFPRRSPRNLVLAVLTLLVVAAAAIMIWQLRQRPEATEYTMEYGQGALSLTRFGELFLAGLLPFRTGADIRFGLLYPANILVVAVMAFAVNGLCALLLARGRRHDLNVRAAWLHLSADAAGSLAAAGAGVAVLAFDAELADPIASLAIAALVLVSTWHLLRDTTNVLLEGAPRGLDLDALEAALVEQPHVEAVHHLHVWELGSNVPALSVHVVLDGEPTLHDAQSQGRTLKEMLAERFGIEHATLELECHDCESIGSGRHVAGNP